jgi:PUA domain protein
MVFLKVLFLSKREARELETSLHARWSKFKIPSINPAKKIQVDEDRWIVTGDCMLIIDGGDVSPFIGDERFCSFFPHVLVDMGALKFITNGANVMRPGVRSFPSSFDREDTVIVRDEKFGKIIASCIALFSREEAEGMSKGPILKNLSYVGDKFWKAFKELGPSAQ